MSKIRNEWMKWFLVFIVFSFIGWVYELLVFHFELGYGFINRGFLFGPYLPVYGFGGLLMLVSMVNLKNKRTRIVGDISEMENIVIRLEKKEEQREKIRGL